MCARAMYAFRFLPSFHSMWDYLLRMYVQLIALLRPVQLLLNSFTTRGKEALIVSR